MEINKNTDIIGVITYEAITEGRMVLLTSHPGYSTDVTGRLTDLPGVKLPDTTAEASRARYVITWPVDNRQPPLVDWPAYAWALRQGFDQATNAPITGKTIYLTYPGYQESVVIPSGNLALAFGQGVFTIPSGQFVYNAAMLVPGTALYSCDTNTDSAAEAGQLTVTAGGRTAVGAVERFNSTAHKLTVRTFNP